MRRQCATVRAILSGSTSAIHSIEVHISAALANCGALNEWQIKSEKIATMRQFPDCR
jgi:hypothetical protein